VVPLGILPAAARHIAVVGYYCDVVAADADLHGFLPAGAYSKIVLIDVHTTCVIFCRILEAQLLAHLLDTGFDLLDVVYGVISFSDNADRKLSAPVTPMHT
jgi:hypothetical protein